MNDATKLLKLWRQLSMSAYFSPPSKNLRGCVTDFYILSGIHDIAGEKHLRSPLGFESMTNRLPQRKKSRFFLWRHFFQPVFSHFNMNVHCGDALQVIWVVVFIYLFFLYSIQNYNINCNKTLKEDIKGSTEGDDVCYKYAKKKKQNKTNWMTITKYNILSRCVARTTK